MPRPERPPREPRIDDPAAAAARLLDLLIGAAAPTYVAAVNEVADERVFAALGTLLAARAPALRVRALEGLARAGNSEALATAAICAGDGDPVVRIAAFGLMDEMGGDPAGLDATGEAMLTDPVPEVRLAAVHAVASVHGEAATRLLEQARADADARVRDAAARWVARRRR